MKDEMLVPIVKKFARQGIVLGNWVLNCVLREHPELADSDEVRELRRSIRELTEEENHL